MNAAVESNIIYNYIRSILNGQVLDTNTWNGNATQDGNVQFSCGRITIWHKNGPVQIVLWNKLDEDAIFITTVIELDLSDPEFAEKLIDIIKTVS